MLGKETITNKTLKKYLKQGLYRVAFGAYILLALWLLPVENIILKTGIISLPLIVYFVLTIREPKKLMKTSATTVGFILGAQVFFFLFRSKPLIGMAIFFIGYLVYRYDQSKKEISEVWSGVWKEHDARKRK